MEEGKAEVDCGRACGKVCFAVRFIHGNLYRNSGQYVTGMGVDIVDFINQYKGKVK